MAAAAVAGSGDGDPPPRQRLTIAFIGAKGVGKSSIIKQFVSNEFSDVVCSTERPQRYTTSLVTDANRIIEINISDFPAIDKFPEDSLAEWNLHTKQKQQQQQQQQSNGTKCSSAAVNNKPQPSSSSSITTYCGPPQSFCRLRQVSAYVLVFDASRPQSTFQYLKQMREQILRHGGPDAYKRPIVVAANKQDLVRPTRTPPRSNKIGAGAQQRASSTEWSCQVRKQWRCHYVECSAKFNWQIIHLFQQAVQAIESRSMNGSDRAGTEGYRGIAGGLHHLHMLHMPHLAQLAVGGLGNLASLPGIMPPAFPPLPDPPPPPPLPLASMRQRSSSGTRLSRAVSRCPLS